jgi:hypothetical protein
MTEGRNGMHRILIFMTLVGVFALPAFADDSRLLTSITLPDLQAILSEEGHTIESTGDEGAMSIRATDSEGTGLIFNLIGRACDMEGYGPGCLGIDMQVRYDADGEETLERINDANLIWPPTKVWYSQGGVDGNSPTVGVSLYVILDGGMTVRNIKDYLTNLLAIAPQIADHVWDLGDDS